MYLYRIPSMKEEQPEWFRSRLRKVNEKAAGLGRNWLWHWNDMFDRKVIIRDGAVNLVFNDESDFVWFSLREL